MRVFYASGTSPNAYFPSTLWRENLYSSLVDLGCDVVEFDFDLQQTFQNLDPSVPLQKEFIARNRPKLADELMRQIKAAHAFKPIDLFFSYFYDACITTEAIDEIRAMGIKTVNWYCNGSYQLHLVSEISPHYDWCLVPEKFRLKDYAAMGANPIYCQEAANPKVYKPYELPVEYDVTFVGQAYGERPAYIAHLLEQGVDVRVWGYGWLKEAAANGQAAASLGIRNSARAQRAMHIGRKLLTPQGWQTLGRRLRQKASGSGVGVGAAVATINSTDAATLSLPPDILGGVLSDLEVIQLYSRSRINLGFSTCGNTQESGERIMQIRLRDFEVPMSGGFYMVEYMEELEEFFEIGKEIVCYADPSDLADKIKYYLGHDHERETIRLAGHERCLRDHTWQKRFGKAFEEMNLN
jgi:spore maturation protein CgeB